MNAAAAGGGASPMKRPILRLIRTHKCCLSRKDDAINQTFGVDLEAPGGPAPALEIELSGVLVQPLNHKDDSSHTKY